MQPSKAKQELITIDDPDYVMYQYISEGVYEKLGGVKVCPETGECYIKLKRLPKEKKLVLEIQKNEEW